jgi:hypothetical protein
MVSMQLNNPTRRKTNRALAMIGLVGLLFLATQVEAWLSRSRAEGMLAAKQSLVSELQLTDVCLFTEARYTRHPSQADLHTPFQDHPLSFDHFPSGSLIKPPTGVSANR